MTTQIIKPGLLVALSTSVKGGIRYERIDLGTERIGDTERANWETHREIADLKEYEGATQTRNKCSSLIRSACVATSFGLFCPTANEEQLDRAISEVARLVEIWNRNSQHTRIAVFVVKGKIAGDDETAARAIAADMRGLLAQMDDGIKRLDPDAIRSAANAARALGKSLDESKQRSVNRAIEQARTAAREIVKRIDDGADGALAALRSVTTTGIEAARFEFMDIDTPPQTEIDFTPPPATELDTTEPTPATDAPAATGRELEVI